MELDHDLAHRSMLEKAPEPEPSGLGREGSLGLLGRDPAAVIPRADEALDALAYTGPFAAAPFVDPGSLALASHQAPILEPTRASVSAIDAVSADLGSPAPAASPAASMTASSSGSAGAQFSD